MSGGVFTGTPPSVLAIVAGGWYGQSSQYDLQSSTTTEARYNLAPWPGDYDIVFSIDQSTGDLVLDVQDSNDTQQQYDPYKFTIGASSAHTSGVASGPVQAGDTIRLWTGSGEQARIVVPANLAVTGWSSGSSSGSTYPSSISVSGGTWGSYTYDFVSETGTQFLYRTPYDPPNSTTPNAGTSRDIYFDTSDNKWYDGDTGGAPSGFWNQTADPNGTNAGNPSVACSANDTIKLTDGGASGNRGSFTQPTITSASSGSGSGSGSGGGIQTLSGGTSPEIINVQFTKLSDDSLEVSFDYQNISHFTMFRQWPSGTAPYNVWSNMGGVGTSGSWSGGGSFLQSLSEDTKVWVVGSTDADGNMPVYTHRILDWEIDKTTTPHSMKVKAFFENNGGNGFGFNADVGLHACGPKLSTGCGIKDTQIYDGNLQEMSSELVWGTLYKVLKPDNTQYGRAYQYGKISKSGGSSNFW